MVLSALGWAGLGILAGDPAGDALLPYFTRFVSPNLYSGSCRGCHCTVFYEVFKPKSIFRILAGMPFYRILRCLWAQIYIPDPAGDAIVPYFTRFMSPNLYSGSCREINFTVFYEVCEAKSIFRILPGKLFYCILQGFWVTVKTVKTRFCDQLLGTDTWT